MAQERRVGEEIHDKERTINRVVNEVTVDAQCHCICTNSNCFECLKWHSEKLDGEDLPDYMTKETYKLYEDLSEEERERVLRLVREKVKRHAQRLAATRGGGNEEAVHRVVYDVMADVLCRCICATFNCLDCLLWHIEKMSVTVLPDYLPRETYRLYMTLSDEERKKVLSIVQEKVKKHAQRICEIRGRRYQDEYIEDEDSACEYL